MEQKNHALPWYLFADLLEKRAKELKAKGLEGPAIALIGASSDATEVADAIEHGLLDCDGIAAEPAEESAEKKPS